MRACGLWLAVLTMAALGHAWAAEEIAFGRYHALVIGNNEHIDLPKPETAVNDAEAVAELTDEDNLVIYYAGHGYLDRAARTAGGLAFIMQDDRGDPPQEFTASRAPAGE